MEHAGFGGAHFAAGGGGGVSGRLWDGIPAAPAAEMGLRGLCPLFHAAAADAFGAQLHRSARDGAHRDTARSDPHRRVQSLLPGVSLPFHRPDQAGNAGGRPDGGGGGAPDLCYHRPAADQAGALHLFSHLRHRGVEHDRAAPGVFAGGAKISPVDPFPGDGAGAAVCRGGHLRGAHDPFVSVHGQGPDPGNFELDGGRKMKHKLLAALGAILVFSGVMSLISAKNYAKSLNRVTLTETHSGTLRTQTEAAGFLHFVSCVTVELPKGCGMEKALVAPGDPVTADQALVQLRSEDLLRCRLELLLAREREKALRGLSSLEKELAELELQALDAQLTQVEAALEAGGLVKSPAAGQVISLSANGGAVEIGLRDGGFYCTWEVPKNENKAFTAVSVDISQKERSLTVEAVGYDAARAVYQYRSEPFEPEGSVNAVLPVEVTLRYESREYTAVLPRRCIRTDSDGSAFVYVVEEREKVYGTELYLRKKGVTVLEEDADSAAVIAKLENVVKAALRTPVDLEAVRVME